MREDADVGHSILRVTATDLDEGDNGTVKYAITGGHQPGKDLSIYNYIKHGSIQRLLTRTLH